MESEPQPVYRIPIGRLLFGIVAITALLALGRQFGGILLQFAEWVAGLGWRGPIIFMFGYIAATVAFVPGALLTLAAGAVFGLASGVIYVFTAATIGAALAFLVGRYIARGAVEQRLEGNERFSAVDRAVGREGFKIVLLLRLSPVFPFNLLNYALGLTNVRFVDYLAASVGMLPGSLMYVYLGWVLGDVAGLAGGASEGGPTWFVVAGLAMAVVATIYITRTAQRALQEATDS